MLNAMDSIHQPILRDYAVVRAAFPEGPPELTVFSVSRNIYHITAELFPWPDQQNLVPAVVVYFKANKPLQWDANGNCQDIPMISCYDNDRHVPGIPTFDWTAVKADEIQPLDRLAVFVPDGGLSFLLFSALNPDRVTTSGL